MDKKIPHNFGMLILKIYKSELSSHKNTRYMKQRNQNKIPESMLAPEPGLEPVQALGPAREREKELCRPALGLAREKGLCRLGPVQEPGQAREQEKGLCRLGPVQERERELCRQEPVQEQEKGLCRLGLVKAQSTHPRPSHRTKLFHHVSKFFV